jgi:hypothetical protein
MDRLLGILIGYAMISLLIWIDPKEPRQSSARRMFSLSPEGITFASIAYWKHLTYASTFGSTKSA